MDLLLQNVLLFIICLGCVRQKVIVPPCIDKEIMMMMLINLLCNTSARQILCSQDLNLCRIYPSLAHNFPLLGYSQWTSPNPTRPESWLHQNIKLWMLFFSRILRFINPMFWSDMRCGRQDLKGLEIKSAFFICFLMKNKYFHSDMAGSPCCCRVWGGNLGTSCRSWHLIFF